MVEIRGEYSGVFVDGIKIELCLEVIGESKSLLLITAKDERALYEFIRELKDVERIAPARLIDDEELKKKIAAYKDVREHPVRFS